MDACRKHFMQTNNTHNCTYYLCVRSGAAAGNRKTMHLLFNLFRKQMMHLSAIHLIFAHIFCIQTSMTTPWGALVSPLIRLCEREMFIVEYFIR